MFLFQEQTNKQTSIFYIFGKIESQTAILFMFLSNKFYATLYS